MRKIGLFLLLLLCMPITWAEERVALVIGNSHYQNEAPLKNPVNDAEDIAEVLERLNFKVTLKTNLDRKAMALAIRDFGKQLKPETVGLFYFSGHGMQVAGHNYLIPVSASIAAEDEVPFESIDAGRVLAKMEKARNGLNIIILDACRNNRFHVGFKGSKQGLARITAPVGSVLVYATAPGDVAADGRGRNGLFTKHLLDYIEAPGLTISDVLLKTRVAVVNESRAIHPKRQQVPWESSSLLTPFCFAGCGKTHRKMSLNTVNTPVTRTVAHVSTTQLEPKVAVKVLEPEMVAIPAGHFRMGCVNNETTPHCENHNKPIALTIKAFDLGKTEVTFAQWDNCVKAGGCSHKPKDSAWGRGQQPVINVSWEDAQEYVRWLSQRTGKNYRLPTEPEWEYAARLGAKKSLNRSLFAQHDKTVEVLRSKKNALGLYGMYGNAWEWTQNCYHEAYDQPLAKGWDKNCYQYESGSLTAVLRGGSWITPPAELDITARSINYRNQRDLDYGFRVVRGK